MVFHMRFVYIAGGQGLCTKGSAKDATHRDRRANRHIHHRTTGDALGIAAAVCSTYLSAHQVNDSGMAIERCLLFFCRINDGSYIFLHTHTTPCTCAEDFHLLIVVHGLRHVNKHIAAVLQVVAVFLVRIALASTVDFVHHVVHLGIGGPEVHNGIHHVGLAISKLGITKAFTRWNRRFSSRVEIIFEFWVGIVVCTIAAGEDTFGTALQVLCIGISCQHTGSIILMHLAANVEGPFASTCLTNLTREVYCLHNSSTQIVATVCVVTNPREALLVIVCIPHILGKGILIEVFVIRRTCLHLSANICLGVSKDISIT